MPSREETDAILKQIENLKNVGNHLLASLDNRPGQIFDTQSSQYKRWIRWLNEALELVQATTQEGGYVHAEATELRNHTDFEPTERPALTEQVGDLLDAAGRATRLKTQDSVGDDLRRAVEIAVKDAYFSSWPFTVAAGAFGLALTVIVGGAVYSTIQVNGIQQRAEQAAQAIRDKSADFEKQLAENTKEIQEKTSHIDDIIRNIVTSDEADFGKILKSTQDDLNGYITETKSKLDITQTQVVANMNGELRDHVQAALAQVTGNINSEGQRFLTSWGGLDKKITDQASTASTAVDQAKDNAIKLLNGPTTEVEAAKGVAISAVQKTQTEATNTLKNYEAEAAGKRDDTVRNMGKMQDDVNAKEQVALQQVDAALAKLPERTTGLINAVAAVDEALKVYRVDVARILTDFSAQQSRSSLGQVVVVLGVSFWLVLGSLLVSVLAVLISLFGLWRRTRVHHTAPTPGGAVL